MMGKNKKLHRLLSRLQEDVSRLHAFWIGLKYKSALCLETLASRCSRRRAMMILIFFCLFSATVLGLIVARSFSAPNMKEKTRSPAPKIKAIPIRGSDRIPEDAELPKRLHRARQYLDSLSRDRKGNIIYDSLIKRRPGLMDSLKQAEYYYNR